MTASTAAARPRLARRRRSARPVRRVLIALVTLLLVVIEVYPLFWLFSSSLKTQNEFLQGDPFALPASPDWGNYADAIVGANFLHYVLNSLIATVPSLLLVIVLGTAAGFALEVLVFRGRGAILLVFLAGIMIPGQMILLPLFAAYYQTGLTGTLWPLIITYTATGLPLTVFMMATFFRAVPREVFEASTIDGAGMLRSFALVGVPMVRNGVFTVALVQFFFIWNDLLVAITFTNSSELGTIQVGLLNFSGQYGSTAYGPLLAAISLNVGGLLIIYLALNQRIMRGLAAGSVKG
ncbi:carbohydrate ABC transporter permease [uncultured Amnibacterium sp.]|uniref:carbohydrate ABC transporter permease n=1 Tax=uncultured Amnibacterium sp. TaxID=1631851 RepID=UPI0035CB63F9